MRFGRYEWKEVPSLALVLHMGDNTCRWATMSNVKDDDPTTQCLALVLEAPPGQQRNVLSDIQGILSSSIDADEVADRARPILEQRAHEQLLHVPIELDGQHDEAILCDAAKRGDVYLHPRLSCQFSYDPIKEAVGAVTACPRPTDTTEKLRAAVDKKLSQYVYQHYQTGVTSTFALGSSIPSVIDEGSVAQPSESDGNETQANEQPEMKNQPSTLCMHIVGNKYNLRNFWAGRWRSTYVVDVNARAFSQARIQIQSHYFENGNVQMFAGCQPDLPTLAVATDDELPEAIFSAIHAYEQAYQDRLYETTNLLRDGTFKALRRTLPITRQKIDWDKVVSYKLGSELANK